MIINPMVAIAVSIIAFVFSLAALIVNVHAYIKVKRMKERLQEEIAAWEKASQHFERR